MPMIHALPAALTPLLLALALAGCSSGPQAAAEALPPCPRPRVLATAEELRNAEEDVALARALLLGGPKNTPILAQETPAKSGFGACDRLLNALRHTG